MEPIQYIIGNQNTITNIAYTNMTLIDPLLDYSLSL